MKPKEKIGKWPDSPDYFSKTNVESIIRDLKTATEILVLPGNKKINPRFNPLVNFPGLVLKEGISKD